MQSKVVVITGASSGIGAALGSLLAKEGYTVYGLSRRGTAPEGVKPLSCDVTDASSLRSAIDTVLREATRIDIAVLCAGCGIAGAVSHLPEDEVKRQMDVNLLGAGNCLAALTPALRESGGRVLAIGSVAGVFPIPFQAHYSAGKAALESLIRAYAGEVAPLGIEAGIALLGDASTGFTASRTTYLFGDELYGGRIAGSVGKMAHDEERGASPEAIARALYRRMRRRRLPRRFTVGLGYRALVLLDRLLPARWVDAIVARLYR